jgi:hypothetical protein
MPVRPGIVGSRPFLAVALLPEAGPDGVARGNLIANVADGLGALGEDHLNELGGLVRPDTV